MVRGDMPQTSNATLRRLAAEGDSTVAGLAVELLQARDDLRVESIRCAELAATHSIEASAAIRESAQLRENQNAIGSGPRLTVVRALRPARRKIIPPAG